MDCTPPAAPQPDPQPDWNSDANPWRQVMIEEHILNCDLLKEHCTDPKKSLRDLIKWEVMVALDPVVSEDAQRLIELGRKQPDPQVLARTLISKFGREHKGDRLTQTSAKEMYESDVDEAAAIIREWQGGAK